MPVSVFAQQISQLSLDAEPPPLSLSHLPRFTHFLCVPSLPQSSVVCISTPAALIAQSALRRCILTSSPSYMFSACSCVSPDAPTNPVLYYLGRFDPAETKFILEGSKGPIRLDLGDILYAPNIQTDAEVCRVHSAIL